MELFRIAQEKYSVQLIASGTSGRWNMEGQHVLYTGSSRSLSTLELVVNQQAIQPVVNHKVMVISLADHSHLVSTIHQKELPQNWRYKSAYQELQKIGSDWYRSGKSLILKVPSAIVTMENNYIINTKHPDFNSENLALVRREDYFWDDRLYHAKKR
jgi:RES domain-containing protein